MCEVHKDSVVADSIHLKIEPDEKSQLILNESESTQSHGQVYLIQYSDHTCTPVTLSEALSYSSFLGAPGEWHFLCFINLSPTQTCQVRHTFRLHPLLDSECSPSVFNIKDSILSLPDHTLLTVSEIDEDYDHTIGIKIAVLSNMILLFASRLPLCLAALTCQKKGKSDNLLSQVSEVEVPIEEDEDCNEIFQALYRMMEANTHRIEIYVLKIISEAKLANIYASELSYHERVDFIQRINMVKKGIILAQESVSLKAKLFKSICKAAAFPVHLHPYFRSLQSRNENMSLRIESSGKLVEDAEHMYSATVDDTLANGAEKLNTIMKRYAAISVMFLPFNLIGTYFGMNVTVPWEAEGDINAFAGLASFGFFLFLSVGVFFKLKGWL